METTNNSNTTNVSSIIKRLSLEFKNGKVATDTTLELTAQLVPSMKGTNILSDAVATLRRLGSLVSNIEHLVALQLAWSCNLGVKGYFCALATAILVVDLVYDTADLTSPSSTDDTSVNQANSIQIEENAQASSMNDITEQLNNSLRELEKHTEKLETFGSLISKMESLSVYNPPSPIHAVDFSKEEDSFIPVQLITSPGVYKCHYGILTWEKTYSSFVGSSKAAKTLALWFNSVTNPSVKCIILNTKIDNLLMIAQFRKKDFHAFVHAKNSKDKKVAFDILFPLFSRCSFQWSIQNFLLDE